MKRVSRKYKYSELNLKIRPLYDLKQKINNSKMPDDLKKATMKWCDQEINKFWRWSYEGRRGYSIDVPKKYQGTTTVHTIHYFCPYGYVDCILDPGYVKIVRPSFFEKLYGDKTPWQAAEKCRELFKQYPEYCPYFDDEDK